MTHQLTLEHIAPGSFPEWLFQYTRNQILQPTPKRVIIIHSSDAAREEILDRLESESIGPIDRSQHHTLTSLSKSLHADCRLPRLLPDSVAGDRLLHTECVLGAKEGEFPLLHPIPDRHWGEGRTRALSRLTQVFDSENISDWNGPGMDGFRSRLKRVQRILKGTHPLLQKRRLLDSLKEIPYPFMLTGVNGIILMNQSPILPGSDRQILLSLLKFCPIHQLCQRGDAEIGNHRLGLHGAILEDVIPVHNETLPEWVPKHEVWEPELVESNTNRLLIPRDGLAIDASMELLRDWLAVSNADSSVLIIDPSWKSRENAWRRGLIDVGLRPHRESKKINTNSVIHWIGEFASISVGPEAWSMDRLRSLWAQKSLNFSEEWYQSETHPSNPEWIPLVDENRLETLARTWHIVGGHGALHRWLRALASKPYPTPWQDDDEANQLAECTQWGVLSLIARLAPLLSPGERSLLEDPSLRKGCSSGIELPLPESSLSGDEWLSSLFEHINWDTNINDIGALQSLLEGITSLRKAQLALKHCPPTTGVNWVEEFLDLLENISTPDVLVASDRVRILTPEESLGTSADLILITHLTSTNWALKSERLPWMDEEERMRLNINRPDSPLRTARHVLHHLLFAGRETVLIDATGLDEDVQPATPIAEWLANCVGADTPGNVSRPEFLENSIRWDTASSSRTKGFHLFWRPARIKITQASGRTTAETIILGRGERNDRQRAGLALRDTRPPSTPPLQPTAISIPLDALLMEDRIRRQPTEVPSESQYLDSNLHSHFVSVGKLNIVPTKSGAPGEIKPRFADSWPVLGGKKTGKNLLATDPRPLQPKATTLPTYDERNGFSESTFPSRNVWSASRLQKWQACPRQGWLQKRLRADALEEQTEDIDARIRGNLIHGAMGTLFDKALGIAEHAEIDSSTAKSLANLGESPEVLFAHILDYLAQEAPWLEREDATASQRRHSLIGLSHQEWIDWLTSPKPMKPTGQLGRMLLAEFEISDSIPISIEWPLKGLKIPHPDGRSIQMTGKIDRVDIIEIPEVCDSSSEATIAPLYFSENPDWQPHRLVVIRDIKSVDGPKKNFAQKKHRIALFDELQLGLYSRAWEVAHPGDLVIGAGISEVGRHTQHTLELCSNYLDNISEYEVGGITKLTGKTHRFPDEDNEPTGSSFRAWMLERLTTAIDIAESANLGKVNPTPEKMVCTYCDVKAACGLAPTVGGDRSWN